MEAEYDKKHELKAFDESKTGLKGLVESGITNIPRIFIHDQNKYVDSSAAVGNSDFSVPIIDLEGINKCAKTRDKIFNQESEKHVRRGWSTMEFSQPLWKRQFVGCVDFSEQDPAIGRKFDTRDASKTIAYNTNFDLWPLTFSA